MLTINLDLGSIASIPESLEAAMKAALRKAGTELTAATHGHILEEANKKLHSRRQMFVDSLTHHQVSEDTWVINLDAKAVWIDEGMEAHSMLDGFLKSPKAKTAKDGSKYLVIPFEHGPKGKTQMTHAQANLLDTIKRELGKINRERKSLGAEAIPYAKIETDAQGKPKLGRLHSFDIMKEPKRIGTGPGEGKGPRGEVQQGPTGIPLLQGISIYQKMVKGKGGKESVKRSIMTFRVASSKHKGQGRWDYPGVEPTNLMEEGYKWALDQWKSTIAPKILLDLIGKL